MSYTISVIQDIRADKNGLRRLRIRVIYNRAKVYAPTAAKVRDDQFNGSRVLNHPKATKLNAVINAQVSGIEDRLLDELRKSSTISKNRLAALVKNESFGVSISVVDYAGGLQDELKGKLSPIRLKAYAAVMAKIKKHFPGTTFADISIPWMNKFEAHLRESGIQKNTINTNMSIVRAILNKAEVDGLVKKVQYEHYKVPKYDKTNPVFLEESELTKVINLVRSLGDGSLKTCGYYFLLSCFAGYRLTDAITFKYHDRVHDGQIVLRATKNGEIVSIPVHTRLAEVLQHVKDNPINITEQHVRKFVKEVCKLAGIRKEVKFHTGRHSFAMLLMKSGFTIDEVARLLGDTAAVATVYAKIHNPTLNAKVMDLLG